MEGLKENFLFWEVSGNSLFQSFCWSPGGTNKNAFLPWIYYLAFFLLSSEALDSVLTSRYACRVPSGGNPTSPLADIPVQIQRNIWLHQSNVLSQAHLVGIRCLLGFYLYQCHAVSVQCKYRVQRSKISLQAFQSLYVALKSWWAT